jgi:uncharacterized protein DUF6496
VPAGRFDETHLERDLKTPLEFESGTHALWARHSMTAKKRSGKRKYGKGASKRVESAMRRRKKGTLRSGRGGKGGKVKSRKQAIAIGLSEARKKGAKVPKKRKSR